MRVEKHFGAALFDRSARRAALTTFGRHMLPSAERPVRLADALAEQAELRPPALAVPATCPVRKVAAAAGRLEPPRTDEVRMAPAAEAAMARVARTLHDHLRGGA